MNFRRALLLSVVIVPSFLTAQTVNWYHSDRTDELPTTINTDRLYKEVIKDKEGQMVVVAVIDSGIDIEHEDLKDVIWHNTDEVPDNGIDDDNNGYIDDINGWNFIGGPDGSQVDADTYEMVRLYAKKRERFNDIDPSTLNKDELAEYNEWVSWGERIDREITNNKKNYDELAAQGELLFPVMDLIEKMNEEGLLAPSAIDSLREIPAQNENIAANVLEYFMKGRGEIPPIDEIKAEVTSPIEEGMKYYGSWKYGWNPDFDPRDIVGDNYADKTERYYGNNLVEGPDAFHGTHVAGIIAATRDNDIGINGISNTARIMVLRAVPDGDERDKDVANAIRYAVDNGASIINMSFGKGHSPYKQVVDDAIRYAEDNDVLLVHAAGNSNDNIDEAENYPNDYFLKPKGFLFWKKKQPKNYISVGASSQPADENMVASFSNYGEKDVDIFAPGTVMFSTTPDNNYKIAQGTSMAAPVVSGIAAVIRSYFPTLTAEQVKEVLMESTVKDDRLVKKPGSEELVPFSSLSISGGVVDAKSAFIKASQTKGKKKIKKVKATRA